MTGLYKIVPYLNGYAVKWRPRWWLFWFYEKMPSYCGSNVIIFNDIDKAKQHIANDINKTKQKWESIERAHNEEAEKKRECREIGIITDDNIST